MRCRYRQRWGKLAAQRALSRREWRSAGGHRPSDNYDAAPDIFRYPPPAVPPTAIKHIKLKTGDRPAPVVPAGVSALPQRSFHRCKAYIFCVLRPAADTKDAARRAPARLE